MKIKILIGLIVVVALITVYFQEDLLGSQPVELEYKGVWMPTLLLRDPDYLDSNAQKLKDMGINTIFIVAFPPQSEQWLEIAREVFSPELIERINETIQHQREIVINNIQTAHRNGLKVGLTTVHTPPEMEDLDIELLNSKIIEYARLAEEYDVEFFAPMGEVEKLFHPNTGEWRQEILPRIKEVYHGKIIWEGTGPGLSDKALPEEFFKEISEQPPGDFSGYDYIGFSIMLQPEGMALEDYPQYIDNALKYKLAQAERDNCKGIIITEFGVLRGGPWNKEEIARAHEIVLEKGKDKVVGFFVNSDFLGEELPGWFIEEDLKTQEVIRRWFTEVL